MVGVGERKPSDGWSSSPFEPYHGLMHLHGRISQNTRTHQSSDRGEAALMRSFAILINYSPQGGRIHRPYLLVCGVDNAGDSEIVQI